MFFKHSLKPLVAYLVRAIVFVIVVGFVYFGLRFASWVLDQIVNATAWLFGPIAFIGLIAVSAYAVNKLLWKDNN